MTHYAVRIKFPQRSVSAARRGIRPEANWETVITLALSACLLGAKRRVDVQAVIGRIQPFLSGKLSERIIGLFNFSPTGLLIVHLQPMVSPGLVSAQVPNETGR
jgi:hypothetical protein